MKKINKKNLKHMLSFAVKQHFTYCPAVNHLLLTILSAYLFCLFIIIGDVGVYVFT